MSKKRVLYYLNQFFGQIGGEEKANISPEFHEKEIGPAFAFAELVGEIDLIGTIVCGDNFFNENKEKAIEFLTSINERLKPDLVVAGPAFNAGRYGMACAGVAELFNEIGIPVVTGMFEENPGLEKCRSIAYVVKTGNSAADMKKALPIMANIVKKIVNNENLKPTRDGYFTQGKRITVLVDKIGSERAIEMLMKRLRNESFETELPMPEFDKVEPAKAILNLKNATIAMVTSGGIVPLGNPDRIQSASAQKWGKYNIDGKDEVKGEYCTIHGGYDPVYANAYADRVAPLDVLYELKEEGIIGDVYPYFYTTTGTGTSVASSVAFGKEIGKELKEAGVSGVLLTST